MEETSDLKILDFSNASEAAIKFYVFCSTMWMNIQKLRGNVLMFQRKLQSILLLYAKRRQRRLGDIEYFYNSNMNKLLEYVRSPLQFYKTFRVTLPAFMEIKNLLYQSNLSLSKCNPEIDLLIFLFWLSGGASSKKVSKLLSIPASTVRDKTDEVLKKCVSKMSEVIHFSKENVSEIGKNFQKLTSCPAFGLVLGCLDAYHVLIKPSSKIDRAQFLNSENELSIQVQVVCDHKGSFMSLAVGFPGNLTKLQVLQHTPLYVSNILPDGCILLGGINYPCLQQPICLLPPYEFCDNILMERFNECLYKAHSVLTYSVGQMFARWRRIFSKPLNLPLSRITKTIVACSVIENICMQKDDSWPERASVVFSLDEGRENEIEGLVSGEKIRKQISESILFDDEVMEFECDYTVYEV